MFTPFKLRNMELTNRIVVSPMRSTKQLMAAQPIGISYIMQSGQKGNWPLIFDPALRGRRKIQSLKQWTARTWIRYVSNLYSLCKLLTVQGLI